METNWYRKAAEMGFGMQSGSFGPSAERSGILPITPVQAPPSPKASSDPSQKPSGARLVAEVPQQQAKQPLQTNAQPQMAEMMRESLKVGVNAIIQSLPGRGLISPQQAQAITNLLASPDMEVEFGTIAEQSMSRMSG